MAAVSHIKRVTVGRVTSPLHTPFVTALRRTETTDTTGLYRFTLLDYGVYRLEAEHAGFKTVVRGPIQLETDRPRPWT